MSFRRLFARATLVALIVMAPRVSAESRETTGWQELKSSNAPFSLRAPSNTVFKAIQGIDSAVGEFVSPHFRIEYDYGQYSNPLSDLKADRLHYTTQAIQIDGHEGILIVGPGHNNGGCNYFVAMYVEKMRRDQEAEALEINGCTQEKEIAPVLSDIFRSIHFTR